MKKIQSSPQPKLTKQRLLRNISKRFRKVLSLMVSHHQHSISTWVRKKLLSRNWQLAKWREREQSKSNSKKPLTKKLKILKVKARTGTKSKQFKISMMLNLILNSFLKLLVMSLTKEKSSKRSSKEKHTRQLSKGCKTSKKVTQHFPWQMVESMMFFKQQCNAWLLWQLLWVTLWEYSIYLTGKVFLLKRWCPETLETYLRCSIGNNCNTLYRIST